MKKIALIVFIVSISITAVFLIVPLLFMVTADSGNSVGIIGGADAPTYQFIIAKYFGGFFYVVLYPLIAVDIVSLICFLFVILKRKA